MRRAKKGKDEQPTQKQRAGGAFFSPGPGDKYPESESEKEREQGNEFAFKKDADQDATRPVKRIVERSHVGDHRIKWQSEKLHIDYEDAKEGESTHNVQLKDAFLPGSSG